MELGKPEGQCPILFTLASYWGYHLQQINLDWIGLDQIILCRFDQIRSPTVFYDVQNLDSSQLPHFSHLQKLQKPDICQPRPLNIPIQNHWNAATSNPPAMDRKVRTSESWLGNILETSRSHKPKMLKHPWEKNWDKTEVFRIKNNNLMTPGGFPPPSKKEAMLVDRFLDHPVAKGCSQYSHTQSGQFLQPVNSTENTGDTNMIINKA